MITTNSGHRNWGFWHRSCSIITGYVLSAGGNKFMTGTKRTIHLACIIVLFCLAQHCLVYGSLTRQLTPSFEWSTFQAGIGSGTQTGFQVQVYRVSDDGLVYDTGFIADASGYSHTYSPGTYSGSDPISGGVRTSESLAEGQSYYLNVRYRDSNDNWGNWATASVDPRFDFHIASPSTTLLSVEDATTTTGSALRLRIMLDAAPGLAISDYSFSLTYDSTSMIFQSADTASTLSANWAIVTSNTTTGVLEVQGNVDKGSPISSDGLLLELLFNTSGESGACCPCSLSGLSGDLLSYYDSAGSISWYKPGDVNLDSRITPGDAQIAFETFLYSAPLPGLKTAAADINTDGEITPSDAALIFGIYLPVGGGKSSSAKSSQSNTISAAQPAAQHFTISEAKGYPGEIAVIKAAVIGARDMNAYAFDLTYDPSLLKFMGTDKAGTLSQAWSSVRANVHVPGQLRIAAYHGSADLISGDNILLYLRFQVLGSASRGTTPLTITRLYDAVSKAAVHNGQVNIEPQPNPEPPVAVPTPVAVGIAPVTSSSVLTSERIAYFMLDDFGAIHTGGAANLVELKDGPYFGWDIARGLELILGAPASNDSGIGAAILDGLGALHTASSSRPEQDFYFGSDLGDIAVDLALFQLDQEIADSSADTNLMTKSSAEKDADSSRKTMPGPIGYYVLDKTGRLWAGGEASKELAEAASISPPLDGISHCAIDITLADAKGDSGWILDNMGNTYPFGGAIDPMFSVGEKNNWVDLEMVDEQLVRMDSSGNLEWSDTPIDNWQLPQVDGELLIDLEVEPGLGLVALDRYGAIYTSGDAIRPPSGQGPPTMGIEGARDLEISIALLSDAPASTGYNPNTFTKAESGRYNPVNWAYSLPTGMDLQMIDTALQRYCKKNGNYPNDLETFLQDNFADNYNKVAFDSWGTPYFLILKSKTEYYLVSSGPDKTLQTKDDLYIHNRQ
jgi:Cohesin domain/Dockerin type I domain